MAMQIFTDDSNYNNIIILCYIPVNSSWLRLADVAVISRGRFGFGEVCAV